MQENKEYYTKIKEILINNEINKRVKEYSKNKVELESYYNVGKILSEAGKHYGEGIIKKYSAKLMIEVNKKYNERTLRRMRQLYLLFLRQNWSPVATKLSWSHYTELLSIKDDNERNYYINRCINSYLSRNDLRKIKKNNEYERLSKETKEKLIEEKDLTIIDEIKNPILINNRATINVNEIKEKTLQKLILEDIENFLS